MSAVAIIFLLWIIVWAVAAAMVWENAKNKDVDPAFWAVIVFVTGIFGVVAYAIVVGGSNSSNKRVCPNCNLANNPNSNYCSDCGEEIKISRRENTSQQKTGGYFDLSSSISESCPECGEKYADKFSYRGNPGYGKTVYECDNNHQWRRNTD